MQITPRGRILCKAAEQLLSAAQSLHDQAVGLFGVVAGRVRIGIYTPKAFQKLPRLAVQFRRQYPNVELEFVERTSGEVINGIATGTLDAGFFLGLSPNDLIAAHRVGEVELVIACPVAWRRRLGRGGWEELAKLSWIGCTGHCPFQAMVEQIFRSKGLTYERVMHAEGGRTRLELVAAVLAWLLSPEIPRAQLATSYLLCPRKGFAAS